MTPLGWLLIAIVVLLATAIALVLWSACVVSGIHSDAENTD